MNKPSNHRVRLLRPGCLVFAAAAVLAACSSAPPKEQVAVSNAAVERATGQAAVDAPLQLAAARAKVEQANAAMAAKDYKLARQLAEQAEADASLAAAQARSARSDQALGEVRDSIRALREQMNAQPQVSRQ